MKSNQVGIFSILILVLSAFILSCNKSEVYPMPTGWSIAGDSSLKTQAPAGISLMKPMGILETIPGINDLKIAKNVVRREGINNYAVLTSLAGSKMSDVSKEILDLITRENPPLHSLSSSTTVSGWLAKKVNFLNRNGVVTNITDQLSTVTSNSLSVIITFFPDGYYTIINNTDPNTNSYGWFEVVMENNLPIAIIYNTLRSGEKFNNLPLIPNTPNQGMGIWGLEKDRFFPLFQLKERQEFFFEMTPINY